MQLAEVLRAFESLPEQARKEVAADAMKATKEMRFVPLPGPQTDAYLSKADVLLYGGSAGSGKSFLLMGLASQEHTRSIVFRRESSQTDGLQEAGRQIIGDTARFNGTDLEWSWPDGRSVKLAGMQLVGDWGKHAGRERDLIGYDEAGEFLEQQVSSLMAWNRGPEGQRCRIVFASNPPRSSDGAWMVTWFAPWLDRQFSRPADAGELRWAVIIKGAPQWVDGPGEHVIDGETYTAMSFTFIPAALKDNPFRDTAEYRARLQSLPEPLRSQLLYGKFDAGAEDDPWQAIPTAWVQAAVARWRAEPPVGVPMCAIGVDVAQGGADNTVLARRHDGWFAPLMVTPGEKTPGGTDVAALVMKYRHDNAKVVIDVGGGWGGDAHGHLMKNNVDSLAYMGVKKSLKRTADGQLTLSNVRSEAYWRFREALNPDQQGGSHIFLPDDRALIADLTAPRYTVVSNGIEIEPKVKLVKRLGRSPDRGDAVVMAWWAGARMASDWNQWPASKGRAHHLPTVTTGRAPLTGRKRQ
jgi:hypothetical protein